jgi:succinate dehydrogenase / fumarate reductase cytochrome b subunit
MTSLLSILHRLTGSLLFLGIGGFFIWLICLAWGKQAYDCFYSFFQNGLMKGSVWFVSVAFAYHFANGIRHLVWDTGRSFDLKDVYRGGWMVIAFTGIAGVFAFLTIFGKSGI